MTMAINGRNKRLEKIMRGRIAGMRGRSKSRVGRAGCGVHLTFWTINKVWRLEVQRKDRLRGRRRGRKKRTVCLVVRWVVSYRGLSGRRILGIHNQALGRAVGLG